MSKIMLSIVIAASTSSAMAVSLDQYLENVKHQNKSYQSADQQMAGSELRKREADLFFTPQFFFNGQSGYDSKLPSPPFLVFDQVKTSRFQAGISQEFSFGVETKFSYDLNKYEYKGITFNNADNPYWEAIPTLELSVPLWGNAFGRTSKARKEQTLQQREFEKNNAEAQLKKTLVEAEVAYWRLAVMQESVAVRKKALDAANSIHNYVVDKKRKNLGEEADILQANALTEAYRLQLEQAEIDERAARRKYNLYLNKEANDAVEPLSKLDYQWLASASIPVSRPADRPDVKASQAQVALARAASQLSIEQNKPKLDLFGGYSFFGRDGKQSGALRNAGYADRDSGYVGVRFQMPLNVMAQNDARKGAAQVLQAAELSNQYLMYSQEQEWTDITALFKDAQTALKLAEAMEKAQKLKLNNERTRLRQGRTTTYQVLLFEQDYLSAEIARIQSAAQIINLNAQIKLYSSND